MEEETKGSGMGMSPDRPSAGSGSVGSRSPVTPKGKPGVGRSPSRLNLSFRRKRAPSESFAWEALPEAVQFHIVQFLDTPSLYAIAQVNMAGRDFALNDVLWKPLYQRKFCIEDADVEKMAKYARGFGSFHKAYFKRLQMPEEGDKVQVLWEGSFNLVSTDGITGYEGRAWWEARIVQREGMDYKIHYSQWDSAVWDEWVTRDRIRWPPDADCDATRVRAGDLVEVKCLSTSGRSPWLESTVARVDGDKYYVGDAIITGRRALPRENVRLVRSSRSSHSMMRVSMSKCTIM